MIYTYIKLINYVGIYNGMFLNEIEIDFTKCKSKIVRIIGDNGAGKSTLINAMSPLPDDNISFIPTMNATKIVGLFDELTGVKYLIRFEHPIDNTGERSTSKGYFTRIMPNGSTEELNPTGKISSCKELIYEEFDLDSNFISLTKMNTKDCGLANKTPSERKRYVNSIINETQAYTDIHKKISKKANYFKDSIKRITTKIDSLGNLENLSLSLQQTSEVINKSEAVIQKLTDEISMAKSKKQLLDPDGSLENEFNENERMYQDLSAIIKTDINLVKKDPLVLKAEIDSLVAQKEDMKATVSNNDIEVNVLITKREEDTKRLQEKQTKLEAYAYQSYSDMESNLSEATRLMDIYKQQVISLGIDINNMVTKDEYISAYNVLQNIQQAVSNYYDNNSDISLEEINKAFEVINLGENIDKKILLLSNHIKLNTDEIHVLESNMTSLEAKVELLKVLDKRPAECNIDSCEFISNALNILKQNPEKEMENISLRITELLSQIKSDEELIESYRKTSAISKFIDAVFTSINFSRNTLAKLGLNDLLKDEYQFMIDIYNHKSYDYITFMHNAVVDANCIDLYNKYKEDVEMYQRELSYYKEKEKLLLEIQNDISELNSKIDECFNKLMTMNEESGRLREEISKLEDLIDTKKSQYTFNEKITVVINKRNELMKKYSEIDECNKIIAEAEAKKESGMKYIEDQKDKQNALAFDIKMINQYLKDIEEIQRKSVYIDLIKRYSNPSQAGIQNIFLSIYMDDIVIDANDIIRNLFNGTLMLKKFVINENEFRLPVAVEGGIDHDDISSLSIGQTALVSMILSFALVNKASSKLNVLTSDELDGSLDTNNRRQFLDTLKLIMTNCFCNQAIMISHNAELSNDECDIILLKNENGDGRIVNGNIIWSYYG